MDVTLEIKTPSGNCYGGSVPIDEFADLSLVEILGKGFTPPDYVDPGDGVAFRCALVAAAFVLRAEQVLNSPIPTTHLAPDTYGNLFDSTGLYTTVEAFAADTASLLWSVPRTWSLADGDFYASLNRFIKERPGETDMRQCNDWLAQVIVTGTAEPITRQVAEYISLRFRGHSAESIAEALACALINTADDFKEV